MQYMGKNFLCCPIRWAKFKINFAVIFIKKTHISFFDRLNQTLGNEEKVIVM